MFAPGGRASLGFTTIAGLCIAGDAKDLFDGGVGRRGEHVRSRAKVEPKSRPE